MRFGLLNENSFCLGRAHHFFHPKRMILRCDFWNCNITSPWQCTWAHCKNTCKINKALPLKRLAKALIQPLSVVAGAVSLKYYSNCPHYNVWIWQTFKQKLFTFRYTYSGGSNFDKKIASWLQEVNYWWLKPELYKVKEVQYCTASKWAKSKGQAHAVICFHHCSPLITMEVSRSPRVRPQMRRTSLLNPYQISGASFVVFVFLHWLSLTYFE